MMRHLAALPYRDSFQVFSRCPRRTKSTTSVKRDVRFTVIDLTPGSLPLNLDSILAMRKSALRGRLDIARKAPFHGAPLLKQCP